MSLHSFSEEIKYNKVPKKILIVEDEEVLIELLKRKLTQEGYQVLIARDGEEGLKVARKITPDLILLNLLLPKRSGFEIMEEMAKEEKLRGIPVIVISNSGKREELERAKNLGAKDWLIKIEFDPKKTIEKVKKQLGE
jgi:DNA-binding response OmpR family regulator